MITLSNCPPNLPTWEALIVAGCVGAVVFCVAFIALAWCLNALVPNMRYHDRQR